jgi:hypothetical protein
MSRATKAKIVIERTYRARIEDVWALWTRVSSPGGGPWAFASRSTSSTRAWAAR